MTCALGGSRCGRGKRAASATSATGFAAMGAVEAAPLHGTQEPTMFNRRKFLAGLLAGPAAALANETPTPSLTGDRKIWVIVGVNWVYNDEHSYPEGDFLTEHAFTDKGMADRTCAELIQEFRKQESPEDFVMPDVHPPDDRDVWSRDQQWDWLFGLVPEPPREPDCAEDGYGWVATPFEVREMNVPASARHLLSQG
jgi:hypothetical protein